jgi:methyl-accepting chemotaxis protein
MDRLINILDAKARSTEAEVAPHGAATYRTTVAIVGGGTVAALLGAFLLTQFFITLPLQRMARAMSMMAAGDLAVPVNGARRGDEIGAMARAVAVFRNNAIELRDTEQARADERARAEAEILRSNSLFLSSRVSMLSPVYPGFSRNFLPRPPYSSWASFSRG